MPDTTTIERQRYEATRRNQANMAKVEQLLLDESTTALRAGRNLGQQAMGGFLREVIPSLVDKWGNVNAAVAVQYYDEQRMAWLKANPGTFSSSASARKQNTQNRSRQADRVAGAKLRGVIYKATAPSTNPLTVSEPIIGKAMARFMGDGFDPMVEAANNAMTRAVASYNRDAILYNAGLDDAVVSVQRVAEPNACAFCALMALSSNAQYLKGDSVRTADYAIDFHNNCHCSIETIYEGDTPLRPDYYDQIEAEYVDAARAGGTRNPKQLLSEWRTATGRS